MSDISYRLRPTPLCDVAHSGTVYTIDLPSDNVSYAQISSVGGVNAFTDIQFQYQVPSNTIVDANVRLRIPLRITVVGTANQYYTADGSGNGTNVPPNPYVPTAKVGLSQFGFYNMVQTAIVDLNSVSSITRQPRKYLHPFSEYLPLTLKELSMDANAPDQFQNFADASNSSMARNVLGPYGDTEKFISRGAYLQLTAPANVSGGVNPIYASANGASCQIVFDVDLCCSMPFSPFISAGRGGKGLVGLKSFNLRLSLDGSDATPLLNKWGTLDNSAVWTSVSVAFKDSGPILLLNLHAMPNVITKSLYPNGIMKPVSYQYDTPWIVDGGSYSAIASGVSSSLLSSTKNIGVVPTKLMVWAEKDPKSGSTNPNVACATTHTYGLITNLQVNFLDKPMLSEASLEQLYQMSVKNGLQREWMQAKNFTGFPILIDLASDLGIGSNFVSTTGSYNLYCQASIKNVASVSQNFRLQYAYITEGVLKIKNDNIEQITSITLTPQEKADLVHNLSDETLDRSNKPFVLGAGLNQYSSGMMVGSGFFSDAWDWIKDAGKKVVETAGPIIKGIADVANVVKTLKGGKTTGGDIIGGKMKKKRGKGFDDENVEDADECKQNPLAGLK